MKTNRNTVLLLLITILWAVNATASSLKVSVGEFSVIGAANKDEMKGALKALLSSRLGSDTVLIVDEGSGAAAQIDGSYTTFGRTFSIDATVKSAAGELLGRRYVQGEGQDDLIPAVGRLAEQLRPLLPPVKRPSTSMEQISPPVAKQLPAAPAPAVVPLPVAAAPVGVAVAVPAKELPETLPPAPGVVPGSRVVAMPSGDIVRVAPAAQPVAPQARIEGALLGIAPGRTRKGDERELVVADAKRVYLYSHGAGPQKIAEYALKGEGKILALDTADADGDGQLEAYVTIIDQEELVSLALAITDQGFIPIAERLPYYFRGISLFGKEKRLYAQQIGKGTDDFFGAVRQVVKNGSAYTLGEPVKLPNYANIFSFNRFADASGKLCTVVIDSDGYLRIFDEQGVELWKGGDRFGGSEIYFQRDEQQMQNLALDRYRWRFIEQRITVAANGEIIVPRNSGLFVIGNNRSYSKNSIFAFVWNGAALDERWHTKESASYLADYIYDNEHKELVTLEQVQKEGLLNKGASTISIKKIE